jgi:hypothetical protein
MLAHIEPRKIEMVRHRLASNTNSANAQAQSANAPDIYASRRV